MKNSEEMSRPIKYFEGKNQKRRPMIIQIYEIQTPQEAEKCIELGVNHIGSVILSQDEWRIPLLRETVRLSKGSDAKSSLIPLFHDSDATYRAVDYYRPDYIHFCDSLTDHEGNMADVEKFFQFQSALKKKFPEVGIIRSIPIPKEGAHPDFPCLEIARLLQDSSDIFLIDTWVSNAPEERGIGITGELADREMARALVQESRLPVILAGGLSSENVYDAVMAVRPAGADSCTRTNQKEDEGNPVRFQKDFQKVKRFVEQVRRAEVEIREEKERLNARLLKLRADLKDREAALPAHSVRPNQIMAIEALEDEIEAVEKELETYLAV
jgi:phosphoribosylanthranilate isomerase